MQAEKPHDAPRAFVLKLGRALHAAGYGTHRLEQGLLAVSRRLGLEAQFFSMPTALFASFGTGDDHRTFQIRVEPGAVDLGRLARLDAVTKQVARGALSPDAGSLRLDQIASTPSPYGPALSTLCFALASAAAGRFFGGGWPEVLAAFLIGAAIGLLALLATRVAAVGRVFEPLSAAVGAFLATLGAAQLGPVSLHVATLSGLILLVPGLPLTIAMHELATRHLISGTARLAATVGTFLTIGFGVALGTRVGEQLAGTPPIVVPQPLPDWTLWLALLVAPLSFTVLLQAERRDAPWIVLAAATAFGGARLGSRLLGPELGVFLGALAVGLVSRGYGRLLDRPASVPLVPGILLLVPGGIGFESLSSLLQKETLPGVEAAFRMTLVAISLATGLLFASALLADRAEDGAEP